MKKIKKILSFTLAGMMTLATFVPAFAKTTDATIDNQTPCSLEMFKYDLTEATKAGVWKETDSYVASGYVDENLETIKDYAIEGVEFSIMPIASIIQYTDETTVALCYGFEKEETVLDVIGLSDGEDRFVAADSLNDGKWYFESEVLHKALSDKLTTKAIETKNSLEDAVNDSENTKVMPLTDSNGRTKLENLEIGLYLVVETKVPEDVVDTTNPFFLSLPMTDPEGDNWNYDVVAYPKNETGDPTLEKEVRESIASTGKTENFTEFATGSVGDLMEYQIKSTLPTITSQAVYLTQYDFVDTIKGLEYDQKYPITIDFYEDALMTKKIDTWAWDKTNGNFKVSFDGKKMTITMTENGLAKINPNYSEHIMVITYGAVITNEAILGETGNPNEITLTWERTSEGYFDTLKDDATVYSFGIDITKLLSDKDSILATTENLFDEVEFLVYNETDGVYINAKLNEKGYYDVIGYVQSEAEATIFTPKKVGSEYGQISIKGLEDDSYTLTEKNTAEGYTLLKDSIDVDIVFNEETKKASATVNGNPVTMLADGQSVNAYAVLTVMNHKGFELPPTGDSTLWLISALAAVLAAGAIVIITIIKKKAKV